jgi:hypothetical protein
MHLLGQNLRADGSSAETAEDGMKSGRKSQAVSVPCDWCAKEIGEDCPKCGGSGEIVLTDKRTA